MSYLNPISLLFDALDPVSEKKNSENTESAAAVLIAITDSASNPEIIYTRRADHLNSHSGQVSFPGGRWEPGDEHLTETALRESYEEICLDPDLVQIKGCLPPRISVNKLDVHPFVAQVPASVELSASFEEIADIFKVPVRYFMESKPSRIDCFRRESMERRVPAWEYASFDIWGLTAMFTYDLLRKFQVDVDFTNVLEKKYER